MRDRLIALLLGLSRRERWLLAGLFGLALPLAIVFLAIMPLAQSLNDARQDLEEASKLHQWVALRAAEMARLKELTPTTKTPVRHAAIGISGIEDSLRQMGLRGAVSRLAKRDGETVELRFDRVDFRQLTDWLEATEPRWGYALQAFRFEPGDTAGLVSADLLLGLPK